MDVNPYRPPIEDAAPTLDPGREILASRGSRFGASLIDAFATAIVIVPVQFGLGMFDSGAQPDYGNVALVSVLGFGLWFLIQIAFLRTGQTLGKRLVGIRMVDANTGEIAPVGRLVFLRYLPTTVAAAVPLLGPIFNLVDVLFIFGSEQRCIHDLIAGTKVVQA